MKFNNLILGKIKPSTLRLKKRSGGKIAKRRKRIYCTILFFILIATAILILYPTKKTQTTCTPQDTSEKINVSLNHRTENPNAWLYREHNNYTQKNE